MGTSKSNPSNSIRTMTMTQIYTTLSGKLFMYQITTTSSDDFLLELENNFASIKSAPMGKQTQKSMRR